MLYVDACALFKRYVVEPDSDRANHWLRSDPDWITARHTYVEVRRNLSRVLSDPAQRGRALAQFSRDWSRLSVVEIDEITCISAASIAESTGARTLDALHLAAAIRAGGTAMTIVTFDHRLAQAARQLGLTAVGP